MRRALITGASGFIGGALARHLVQRGYHVVGLCRSAPSEKLPNFDWVAGDILDAPTLRKALAGVQVVFHAAAKISFREQDWHDLERTNVAGTRQLMQSALEAGVGKFILLSACAVFGTTNDPTTPLDENSEIVGGSPNPYARSKQLAERVALEIGKAGLWSVIVNFSTVYGSGDKKLNSGSVIRSIYQRNRKVVPPGGTSFIALPDLIEGLRLVAEQDDGPNRYVLSSENLTYSELTQRIGAALGQDVSVLTLPRIVKIPCMLAARLSSLRPSASDRVALLTPSIISESFAYKYFSSERAHTVLGWKPKTSLEEAVRQAFDYYQREHLFPRSVGA